MAIKTRSIHIEASMGNFYVKLAPLFLSFMKTTTAMLFHINFVQFNF